jgi:hypothetical protein
VKVIVTTTINELTPALEKFDALSDWHLVIVGDLRTPRLKPKRGEYLSPEDQRKLDRELSDLIGWRKVMRRNMGFLYAAKLGAKLIATVDDDNEPTKEWGKHDYAGRKVDVNFHATKQLAFDAVGICHQQLWHRGFPAELLDSREYHPQPKRVRCDVQADLWNGDPDIDARCRKLHPEPVTFDPSKFPVATNTFAPFNSQNTIVTRAALTDYFCFPYIGRFDDIWGSYVCQAYGHKVVFGAPTVNQVRVGHTVERDEQAELYGYQNNMLLLTALKSDREAWRRFIPDKACRAFDRYRKLMA